VPLLAQRLRARTPNRDARYKERRTVNWMLLLAKGSTPKDTRTHTKIGAHLKRARNTRTTKKYFKHRGDLKGVDVERRHDVHGHGDGKQIEGHKENVNHGAIQIAVARREHVPVVHHHQRHLGHTIKKN
jgi:hypothetical protein